MVNEALTLTFGVFLAVLELAGVKVEIGGQLSRASVAVKVILCRNIIWIAYSQLSFQLYQVLSNFNREISRIIFSLNL